MYRLLLVVSLALLLCSCSAIEVSYDANAIIINGERRVIFSGAMHYPRSTPEMWPDLIQKAKDGGLDAIETYIFWDRHEPHRRKYDFSGNLDFIKFFKLIHEAGLHVVLRIGPYVCAEWTYGGFPVWLFAPQGGPIIIAQIENEYGNIMEPYGEAGKAYIKWAAEMAQSLNIGVPWIMCQQSDAPQPIINTCNGFYCDDFKPNNPKSPKMFTENWTGWYKKWGEKNPRRTAEDVAYSVALFVQSGGVFNNYYMYHGGTNFGRTAGGPYITTSYDYDAPIDEYGNPNEPKYSHLKQLHAAIKLGEKIITGGERTNKQFGKSVNLTTFSNNSTGERFCFLSNTDTSQDANVDLQNDGKYFVPAWSVSILEGCNKEVFNTAKVSAQTTVYAKKEDDESSEFSWMWAPEAMKDTLQGKGKFQAPQLLEQKQTTVDSSDYLWYMTKVDVNGTFSLNNVTLRVNTTGHVLHAFVNRRFVGSQWGTADKLGFEFEKPVSLKSGSNVITLLSATVGLSNYGSFYDLEPTGIVGGPVQLIAGNTTMDLSTNEWSYKIGLNGEDRQLFNPSLPHSKRWRTSDVLPTGRSMTWYKTNFKTPSGSDPVVVDLEGMSKGHAWVNGKSIGRFWPTAIADSNGCRDECDYRGEYHPEKCVWNCGNSTQRWYHVPRSFLNKDTNTLVLFEELGGNPKQVAFKNVEVETICGSANFGYTLELSCQDGQTISGIQFASFGDPQGECGAFQKGSWEVLKSFSIVETACVRRESCSIDVSAKTFGSNNSGTGASISRLAVQAICA